MRAPRGRKTVGAVRTDFGFTLIEFTTAMLLFSIVSAMAVVGLRSYTRSQAQVGTKSEVVSALRYAQTRAVTEGTTYCVDFSVTNSWVVYRIAGLGTGLIPADFTCVAPAYGTKIRGPYTAQTGVSISGAVFDQRSGPARAWALFYPRGSATPGSLIISRNGSSKQYVLTLEALTARVEDN